ncbi:MAG TPA: flagellar motor protein MotB [Acidobacteriaceae bacterium]
MATLRMTVLVWGEAQVRVKDEQIIIVRKKSGHAAHHGGAWKVAYADFVTAMMSLFIVLWLMNSSKPVQEAVGGYFRDPKGTAQKKGSTLNGMGETAEVKQEDMAKLRADLIKSIEKMANFEKLKDQIELTITPEGLRIEMMEDPKGTFFEPGRAQPTPVLGDLLKILAAETGKLPNNISIEGHTDATPYSVTGVYSNWELSTDRANMARRLMEGSGLHTGQVVQVRGFADHNLRKPLQPNDASNRRVSVIIQYLVKPGQLPGSVFKGSLPEGAIAGSR